MDPSIPQANGNQPGRDVPQIMAALRSAAESGEPLPPELLDLKGLNFLGQNFSKLDLSGCNFTGSELSRCDFRDAICAQACFEKATFFQAKLDGAEFLSASFQGAVLTECSAINAGFGQCNVSHANFSMAMLTGATFVNAKAHHADFRTCKLAKARFLDADLSHADFSQSDLHEVDLQQANLDHATFSKTGLRGVQLRGVKNYTTAHWIGADVRDVDFAGAYLVRRHIVDENYLVEFRSQSRTHNYIYLFWWLTSNCGRSVFRWGVFCAIIVFFFGVIYRSIGDQISYTADLAKPYAPWYFSAMLASTMALGDVLPKSTLAQVLVNCETVIGYIGFGGLLTIISTEMGRRGE